ncbi:MAG: SurA N-terminal domain-containing protein [Deltaproteobacteria bacterium]|nr:SurA N-terminal domain-containing protein [Deltaproteobacteria bacterium]
MRKHARSWIMKVLLFIIIIVFVLYFGSMSGRQKAETVAVIDGRVIAMADVQREYNNLLTSYQQIYGDKLNNKILKQLNLKQKALDTLIDQAVILKKADEYNIETTDEEVRTFIMATPAFQRNGVFDDRVYKYSLRYIKMAPEEYEIAQKKTLTAAKLEGLIADAVKVSDQEVYDLYKLQTEKINITYIKLSPDDFTDHVKPSPADLESYFDQHKEGFRIPDQVQLKYLAFLGSDYSEQVDVSKDEIQNYYESHKAQWTNSDGKTLSLRKVENKIIAELKQIGGMHQAGDIAKAAHDIIYQKENFDDYAEENHLKVRNTDFFSANSPPSIFSDIPEFSMMAFDLKKNDISRVLSTESGYYLFTLATEKPSHIPSFKDIKEDIAKRYKKMEAKKICSKKASDILTRLKQGETLQKISRQEQLKIAESGFFNPGGPVPNVGFSEELSDALFQLSKKKPFPERAFIVEDHYLIIHFKERGAVDPKDFDARKDLLKNQLLRLKKRAALASWIEGIKTAMIKEGKLQFKKDIKDL